MDIYEKKLKALDYFKNRLLNSDVKDMIAEIIHSYFIYNAIKKGKEVYKMEEKELIKGEVKGYLELAKFGAKIRRASY